MFVDYDHFVIPTEKHAGDWAFLEHGKVVEVKMEDLSMEEQKKAQVSFSSLDVHTEMTGFHPLFLITMFMVRTSQILFKAWLCRRIAFLSYDWPWVKSSLWAVFKKFYRKIVCTYSNRKFFEGHLICCCGQVFVKWVDMSPLLAFLSLQIGWSTACQ